MKIIVSSILVTDQEKALQFYTNVLGFIKKTDLPAGDARWLTVVSAQAPDGVELLLEPMHFPPAKVYQQALYEAGIPCTVLGVEDIQKEYERLSQLGVVFKMPPTAMGPVTVATLDDTCGNFLQLVQQ